MKKHIAFQAASFELQNVKKSTHNLSNLIHQQRKFEEMWPSKHSRVKPNNRVKEFFDENIFDTNIEIKELDMAEMVKDARKATMLLQYVLEEL